MLLCPDAAENEGNYDEFVGGTSSHDHEKALHGRSLGYLEIEENSLIFL